MNRVPLWARRAGVVLWWCAVVVWFGVQVLRSSGADRTGSLVVFVLILMQAGLYLLGYTRPGAKRRRARGVDATDPGTAEAPPDGRTAQLPDPTTNDPS